MIFEKVNHVIDKLYNEEHFQQKVLDMASGHRKLSDIRKLPLEYRLAFLVLWGALEQPNRKRPIRHRLASAELDIFSHLSHLYSVAQEFEFWILDDPQPGVNLVDLVARPKEGTIQSLVSKYLGDAHFSERYGERVPNCREILSEGLPTIIDPSYYQRMGAKLYKSHHGVGDGYRIGGGLELELEKVEVKFTSSGGARQTFSPAQIEENESFLILSVEPEELKKHAHGWHASNGKEYALPITFHETNDGFDRVLHQEVRAKDARRKTGRGTGRYEISDMIAKLEKGKHYKAKGSIVITPTSISMEREIL